MEELNGFEANLLIEKNVLLLAVCLFFLSLYIQKTNLDAK